MRPFSLLVLAHAGCGGLTPMSPLTPEDTSVEVDAPSDSDDATTPTDDNAAPTADAGPDAEVEVGAVVRLDGSASSDPDDDPLEFAWEFVDVPSGSFASLINDPRVDPSFFADVEGDYVVRLTVDDGGADDADEVTITAVVANGAPTANAGPDRSVAVGDRVALNGSGSADPDGDPLTFAWTMVSQPNGSRATLDDPTSAVPAFTADAAGAYNLQLVVSDGRSVSSADAVRILAEAADDSDCLSCAAEAERYLRNRWRVGDLASGPALVLLPVLALFWQRRRPR
jgi:hypothetical protein